MSWTLVQLILMLLPIDIGVPLCETYRLSKGKSLIAYINDAKYEDKNKAT